MTTLLHPEIRELVKLVYARPPAVAAAAFIIDMIEDAKEGLLRR